LLRLLLNRCEHRELPQRCLDLLLRQGRGGAFFGSSGSLLLGLELRRQRAENEPLVVDGCARRDVAQRDALVVLGHVDGARLSSSGGGGETNKGGKEVRGG